MARQLSWLERTAHTREVESSSLSLAIKKKNSTSVEFFYAKISVASNCYVAHDVRNIMSSIDGVDILICTAREARLQLKRVSPLLFKRKIPLRWNFFVTNLIHFLNILKKRNNLRLHHHMFRQSFLCTKGLLCYEVYLCNPKVFQFYYLYPHLQYIQYH